MYNNEPNSDSLDAGAPDIRLSGNQDPNTQMASDESNTQLLESLYEAFLEKGFSPRDAARKAQEAFNEMSKAPQQNSGIMAAGPKGTYTQNRKQMMMAGGGVANLKNIKGQNHMLAYITPDEANSLQAMGGQKTMTPEGIPAYPPPGEKGGAGYTGDGGGGGGGGGNVSPGQSRAMVGDTSLAGATQSQADAVVEAAVAQAEANKPSNTDLEGINISPITTSSQLSSPVLYDDIEDDAAQLGYAADFTPTDTRTIGEKAIDFYKKYSVPGMITNYLKEPVNQYEGITGEDALGGGDYVQYTDVRDFSKGELNTDYESLDNEERSVVDKAFSDSGGLSDSARDIGLPSSQMEALYDTPTVTTGAGTPTTTEDKIMTLAEADTGLTDAEKTEAFQTSVANQMAANAAAKKNTPFENYYVGEDPTADQVAFMKAAGASPRTLGLEQFAARGGRIGYDQGGIAGIRQPYFLGKIVKKITGGAKKLFKSDALKAAALAAITFKMGGGKFTGGGDFQFGNLLTDRNLLGLGTLATLSPFAMKQKEEEEDELTAMYTGKGIDIPGIRKRVAGKKLDRSEFGFMPESYYAAEGGRIGYKNGESVSPRTAALQAMYGLNEEEDNKKLFAAQKAAQGGRMRADEGGLMNLGGMEKDYRQEGGFVPIGGKEKADDVPARLSKNEFVFTADAVRNAGGGDIDKGAKIMENLMNSLESGGEVSEESQGLEGARGMFANSQQLEKRII